jgi:hypothetical protein
VELLDILPYNEEEMWSAGIWWAASLVEVGLGGVFKLGRKHGGEASEEFWTKGVPSHLPKTLANIKN